MARKENREDILEVVSLLMKMDKTGIALMKMNANTLVARQELEESLRQTEKNEDLMLL